MERFDELEMAIIRAVGHWRCDRVFRDNLKRDQRPTQVMLNSHVMGAAGEFAVAKDLGLFWGGGKDDFNRGDLPGLEIRTTTHQYGNLITFPRDTDFVVLVVLALPEYRIVGGIPAADAHCDKFDPPTEKLRPGSPPQWWVPQSALTPWEAVRERHEWAA